MASGATLTQEELLRSCERGDRLMRAVLGTTPQRTALRFAPALLLLLVAAAAHPLPADQLPCAAFGAALLDD